LPMFNHTLMKKTTKVFVTIVCLTFMLLPTSIIQAQSIHKSNFAPYWQLHLTAGTSLFFGDIKQNKFWPVSKDKNEWRMGTAVEISRQLSPVFGIGAQALYGQLSGTRRDANQYFQDNYIEFTLNASLSLTNLFWKYDMDRRFNVYLLAGLGLTNYNTTVYDLSSGAVIARLGNGYGSSFGGRTLEGILTGGIGYSYQLNKHWGVHFETTNHIMNSDMMDNHPGGKFKYDFYNYTSVGLSFKFGRGRKVLGGRFVETASPRSQAGEARPGSEQKENAKTRHSVEKPQAVELQPVQPKVSSQKQEVTKPKPIPVKKLSPDIQAQKSIIKTPPPPVQPRLEYRVQISAHFGRALSTDYLTKRYHITHFTIREDMHKGYYIYTIGAFDTYEQARTARDTLRQVNGVADAFVVAFKNGYRLSKLPK